MYWELSASHDVITHDRFFHGYTSSTNQNHNNENNPESIAEPHIISIYKTLIRRVFDGGGWWLLVS